MRWLAGLVVVAVCTGARAEELVATRPGIMCVSTEALARLTLPNGDSRTHQASPRPDDLRAASAGGCIDIPPGARVTVQQAFRNTSRVTYAGPGTPADGVMTVPNVDFERAPPDTAAVAGGAPAALVPLRRLPGGGGTTVVLLMDRRIDPAMRDLLWGTGDADGSFENYPELRRRFTAGPPRNAELQLLSQDGAVLGTRLLGRPLAKLEPSPIHGLPVPTMLLTVDYGAGMGGYNGPFSELLAPIQQGLVAMDALTSSGKREAVVLISTLHSAWKVVPARIGGPEEILTVFCNGSFGDHPRQEFETFHFGGGHWTVASRLTDGCTEIESFPPRREFP